MQPKYKFTHILHICNKGKRQSVASLKESLSQVSHGAKLLMLIVIVVALIVVLLKRPRRPFGFESLPFSGLWEFGILAAKLVEIRHRYAKNLCTSGAVYIYIDKILVYLVYFILGQVAVAVKYVVSDPYQHAPYYFLGDFHSRSITFV